MPLDRKTNLNPDGSPELFVQVRDYDYGPANDEEILAQPCVVEALRKAREEERLKIADDLMRRSRRINAERISTTPTLEEVPEPWRTHLIETGVAGALKAAAYVYRYGGLLMQQPSTPSAPPEDVPCDLHKPPA